VAAAAALGFDLTARAGVAINQFDTTTNGTQTSSGFAAWPITANAGDTTANGGASGGTATNNINSYSQPDGPGTADSPANPTSLAQSIEATSSGTLTDIEFIITGTPPTTGPVNLALYDAGPGGTTTALAAGGSKGNASGLTGAGSAGYVPNNNATAANTPQNSGDTIPGSGPTPAQYGTASTTYGGGFNGSTTNGGFYFMTSANLLDSASQSLTIPGYSTTGATGAVIDFQLSGADAVNIIAGEEYVVELTGTGVGQINWYRNFATATAYPYGEGFKGEESLNGNLNRSFAVGLVVVPEPASASLVSLASLGLMARRRNKTA
jgi:hypothetical protein